MKFYEDPEYIKMCSKASEIQKDIVLLPDNFFYATKINMSNSYGVLVHYHPFDIRPSQLIFLPRQDQLQEMSDLKHWYVFDRECCELALGVDNTKYSKEIIALMLIMRRNYNKTWSGKDWV